MLAEKPPKRKVAYGLPPNMDARLEASQEVQKIFWGLIEPSGGYKSRGILGLLNAKGVVVETLAELHGYSGAYFRQVITRRRRDVTVEDIIAESIGIKELEAKDRMWTRRPAEVADAS